jgi:hypothetical protein
MQRRETPLQTLTLSASLLSKIRVGKKEIRHEGRLYDIKNQVVRGDSVMLELYHDRHEEAILDAIGALLAPSGSNPGAAHALPLQHWLAKCLGAAFLPPPAAPGIGACTAGFFSPFFHRLLPPAQNEPNGFYPPPE